MKIKKIKINNFGNLKNKEIEFNNKINIIYGENESGKSTLLKYIITMLYGISRNKKGKEISDYEKYKPWVGEEYSGKLIYELDNKEEFELFRDFNKKNVKIFNKNSEEISKQFTIDKTKGNLFFYEQTNIDEDLFLSTLATLQQEVKLEKEEENILIQKITNLAGTGDDNISFKKIIEKLNKKLIEEVGTTKTIDRPINIIDKKINFIKNEIEKLKINKNKKYEIEEEINYEKNKLINLENKIKIIKEIKNIKEKENLEKEKILINKNIKKELEEKIIELKKEMEKIKDKKIKTKNNKIIFLILLIINTLICILLKTPFKYLILTSLLIYIIIKIIKINKIKKQNKEIIEEENKIKKEIEILEKNKNEKNIQIEKEEKENEKLNKIKIEEIKQKFNNEIKIEELFNEKNINIKYEEIIEQINEIKIKINTLEINKKNTTEKIENLIQLEEELIDLEEQENNLIKKAKSINLTKEILETAYYKMKKEITPQFTEELSKNINTITNGKYKNIIFNDENGMMIELENGNYVPANLLSIGTIDQLYISLRLAVLEDITKEKLPIILDETFAYFDNKRLENIIKYLDEKYNNQILIFTCTKREKEMLENLNIKHNFIQM